MERFFWICLAGALGTGARYLIALWAAQRFGSAFPYGTPTTASQRAFRFQIGLLVDRKSTRVGVATQVVES